VEKALIQGNVPFDIIFDNGLADLSRYRALILADQECLADGQAAQIRKYVESGGGVVATELTSLYDGWRRRRADFALRDVFGVKAEAYSENLYAFRPGVISGQRRSSAVVRKTAGSGRSTYIPIVKSAKAKPAGAAMTSQYWKLPLNAQEILNEIKWAADGLSLEVKGPQTLIAEQHIQDGGKLLVHLLNYDAERHTSVDNVEVSVQLPHGKAVAGIRMLSPDTKTALDLKPVLNQEWVRFTVPAVQTYSVAVIQFRDRKSVV